MSRWIDSDALKEKIDNIWDGRPLSLLGARILTMIDSASSIDLVRCGECKYVGTDATCCLVCDREGMGLKPFHVYPDDFCSYGVRKESE